jgi:hypothetical protein
MQITSGMPGAFGRVTGDLPASTESRIASEYRFNIAYGRHILEQKWGSTPRIGNGDPTVLENWYFAIWAYNGWGWVNNPNNPRFLRSGTAATDPVTYPYQERVLYLVAHPPRDRQGNPLWPAIPVTLPSRRTIGTSPHSFRPRQQHREPAPAVAAVYQPAPLSPMSPSASQTVRVHLVNSGTQPWIASGPNAVQLTYHLLTRAGDPWTSLSPFSPGVLAFGQHPVPIPHDVLPGGSITVTLPVQAPASPGTYRVVWDLEQGPSSWLSQAGVLPNSEFLQVAAARPTPTPPTATPVPAPVEGLRYLRDTSVPDGTAVAARQVMVKGWLVFNPGQAAWDQTWVLRHVSGKSMGAAQIQVPSTQPCHSATIVAALSAPAKPGRYKSVWRLVDPGGTLIGDPLTVVISVRGGSPPPTPTASPSPSPAPPRASPTPTPAG